MKRPRLKLRPNTVELYPCCTHCPPNNDCIYYGDKSPTRETKARGHTLPCLYSGHYNNGHSECKQGGNKIVMRILSEVDS